MSQYNLPSEIKPIYRTLETISRRHNIVTCFEDYLSTLVNFFTPPDQKGFGIDWCSKYDQDELNLFADLVKETVKVYERMITPDKGSWYDPFGELYMFISSVSKSKALGQFFTPTPVVDLMVKMNYSDDLTGKGLRISDPTCGSGRMLIAFQAHHPGNYVFGEDLDLICCKMTLINLLFHGCEGEVVWHDSLKIDFYRAWRVNPFIRKTGLPSIYEISQEQSFICRKRQEESRPEIKLPSQEQKQSQLGSQLALF